MTDIGKLKQAFEKKVDSDPYDSEGNQRAAADLFWPFVEYVLNDKHESIQKITLINQLKSDLGMELMAHELVGVKK